MKLDVVVPIYNNEKLINNFYNELSDLLKDIKYSIIFVDNSSTDNSLNILKEIYKSDDDHVKIIVLSKKFDKESSIVAGLKYSKNDVVGIIDVNDSPKYISKMYKFLKDNNEYDCICMCNKSEKKSFFRKELIKYTSKHTNIKNIDEHSNVKMMRKNMALSVIELSNQKGYTNAIYDIVGFNIYYDYSYTGKIEKDNLCNYIFNYSKKPFKPLIHIGELIVALSLIYLVYSIVTSFNKISLLTFLVSLFSGLIICALGIVSNYLIKVIRRDCSISFYIVKSKTGFDENYL